VGEHEGGQVAAPIFKRRRGTGAALPRRAARRPITAKLIQGVVEERTFPETSDTSLDDFNPADFQRTA